MHIKPGISSSAYKKLLQSKGGNLRFNSLSIGRRGETKWSINIQAHSVEEEGQDYMCICPSK